MRQCCRSRQGEARLVNEMGEKLDVRRRSVMRGETKRVVRGRRSSHEKADMLVMKGGEVSHPVVSTIPNFQNQLQCMLLVHMMWTLRVGEDEEFRSLQNLSTEKQYQARDTQLLFAPELCEVQYYYYCHIFHVQFFCPHPDVQEASGSCLMKFAEHHM